MKHHGGKASKIWGPNFSNKRGIFMWCISMHNLISDKKKNIFEGNEIEKSVIQSGVYVI